MAAGRSLRTLCLIVLTALLLAAPAAGAVPPLHTGSTRYMRIVRLGHGQFSVALTGQGRKRFARLMHGGYALDATCTTLGKSVQGFSQHGSSGAAESRLGPDGRATYHTLLDRHADFCDIGRVRLTITRRSISAGQVPGPTLDSIALTQKGAAFLDDDRVTSTIFVVLEVAIGAAQHRTDGHFPPAGQFAAGFGLSRLLRLVALVSPDASPPPGTIGFYSDGTNHAEAVGISTLGRRLFIDSNTGVLSTNAAEHWFAPAARFGRTQSGSAIRPPGAIAQGPPQARRRTKLQTPSGCRHTVTFWTKRDRRHNGDHRKSAPAPALVSTERKPPSQTWYGDEGGVLRAQRRPERVPSLRRPRACR